MRNEIARINNNCSNVTDKAVYTEQFLRDLTMNGYPPFLAKQRRLKNIKRKPFSRIPLHIQYKTKAQV
ncbi:Hypothetical predicted protein [Octopus vulgaris]|uniref:Uncharacterized protein n=1 Tax=Octopus vulgaris TaxID=6645 RepID=A0AA36B4K1_OCTVU|nr:Hypothetical predicted protein [Octopus vulgaris]